MSSGSFIKFWSSDGIRDVFLSSVHMNDLSNLRLACHDFGAHAAPYLFEEIKVNFRPSVFSKPVRMAALARVGKHVQTFHFNLPHGDSGDDTFLAPLIDDMGRPVSFVYEPYTETSRDPRTRHSCPAYGSPELTDLLVKQYPPLFHAAANVPSFIRTFQMLENLKHLKISCPGQDSAYSYRRSVVDYALISLRVAVERSRLKSLDTLSLLSVHPSAAFYLNPVVGLGCRPNSVKKWNQIRDLTIQMENISVHIKERPDHLKHLHNYLRVFASSLQQLRFRWEGEKGPCPTFLDTEACTSQCSPSQACPRTFRETLLPLSFPRLQDLKVENAVADASQISTFIARHGRLAKRQRSRSLTFDTDLRHGTWDEALEPLTTLSGSEKWKEGKKEEEFMDVPLMMSPIDLPEEQLNRVWNNHIGAKASKACHNHYSGLQRASAKTRELFWGTEEQMHRAGARTKELIFGTEEHMRRIFRTSRLGWR